MLLMVVDLDDAADEGSVLDLDWRRKVGGRSLSKFDEDIWGLEWRCRGWDLVVVVVVVEGGRVRCFLCGGGGEDWRSCLELRGLAGCCVVCMSSSRCNPPGN